MSKKDFDAIYKNIPLHYLYWKEMKFFLEHEYYGMLLWNFYMVSGYKKCIFMRHNTEASLLHTKA